MGHSICLAWCPEGNCAHPAAPAEAGAAGTGAAAAGARPGQKAGKVVFGSGNRLLDKQLAAQGKARPLPFWNSRVHTVR